MNTSRAWRRAVDSLNVTTFSPGKPKQALLGYNVAAFAHDEENFGCPSDFRCALNWSDSKPPTQLQDWLSPGRAGQQNMPISISSDKPARTLHGQGRLST